MIPVNEPRIGRKESEYVEECLSTGWVSSGGKFLKAFEEGFASYCGREFGIAMCNGTSALIAAFRALDFPPGSEVIVPSFSIMSCALACIYNDLVPRFIDADPMTWNANLKMLESAIGPQTRAILVVHIYGHPEEMDVVLGLADDHRLVVVEDFAEAIGSEFRGRRCGSFGAISCTSFYANKTITTGEGGMCLTDDPQLAERLRSVRNLCFQPKARFVHERLGFNFRMTNLQAAIGLAQLERIDEHVQTKREIARSYRELLEPLQARGLIRLPVERPEAFSTFWMYGVVLEQEAGQVAAQVMDALRLKGVDSRPFFSPLHLQPAFRSLSWYEATQMETAEKLAEYGLYLPSGLTLSKADIVSVCEKLTEVLDGI